MDDQSRRQSGIHLFDIDGPPAMVSYSSSTPPLESAQESSSEHSLSVPNTPLDSSPFMAPGTYALPPVDLAISLPLGITNPESALPTQLPDILDPETAGRVQIRRICCIGAGYVGGPTAAMIALHNPHVRVTVVDRYEPRIDAWKGRHLPIYEPGLKDVVRLARDGGGRRKRKLSDSQAAHEPDGLLERQPNLFFSTACTEEIAKADMVLISVNTNTKKRGIGAGRATDMAAVEGAVRDVAIHARPKTIVVEKSTVPVKTGQLIKDIMKAHRPGVEFPVLSNPEFLAEGTAVRDLMTPDRVVIGCEQTLSGHRAAAALANLYAAWVPRCRIAPMNIWSSELAKLTANAFLAQKISSINSISAICDKTGADVGEVAKAIGLDARIGPQFLKAGLGFGGSCFRKDIASLTYLAESLGEDEVSAYWQAVLNMNNHQRDRFTKNVIKKLNNSLRGKKIAILGYAFKKDTGDARESPALDVVRVLLEEDPQTITIFDPLCSSVDIRSELGALDVDSKTSVEIAKDPYQACRNASAVLVLTEWDMFKNKGRASLRKDQEATSLLDAATPPEDSVRMSPKATPAEMRLGKDQPPAKTSPLPLEMAALLIPEPACAEDCSGCAEIAVQGQATKEDITNPLDWNLVARLVKEPRWVFDGRNMLDARIMASMGFRLETLGRARRS